MQEAGRMSHSTTSLVIVCLIILVLGLVTGVGLTTWYNHACNEVSRYMCGQMTWTLAQQEVEGVPGSLTMTRKGEHIVSS